MWKVSGLNLKPSTPIQSSPLRKHVLAHPLAELPSHLSPSTLADLRQEHTWMSYSKKPQHRIQEVASEKQ